MNTKTQHPDATTQPDATTRPVCKTPLTRPSSLLSGVLVLILTLVGASAPAQAAGPIFSEDFSGYSGNGPGTQFDTDLPVFYGGTVPGWSGAGPNHSHSR